MLTFICQHYNYTNETATVRTERNKLLLVTVTGFYTNITHSGYIMQVNKRGQYLMLMLIAYDVNKYNL